MRAPRRRPPPEPSPLDRQRARGPAPAADASSPAALSQPPGAWSQARPPGAGGRRPQQEGEAAAAGDARAGVLARLRGLAEGGAVVPLPFVRAADLGQPAALLNDPRAAYLAPAKAHLLGNLVSAPHMQSVVAQRSNDMQVAGNGLACAQHPHVMPFSIAHQMCRALAGASWECFLLMQGTDPPGVPRS